MNSYRRTYTYDTDGNLTELLSESWDGSSWVNQHRYTYAFDSEGKLIEWLRESWEFGQWVNKYRYTYAYDSDGNLTGWVNEDWENGGWVKDDRRTYTYDSAGNRTEELSESWDGSSWVNSRRYTHTYDSEGNRTEEVRERWENDQWVNDYRSTYTYDSESNRTEKLGEWWSNGQWRNGSRYTYTYDIDGNRTERLRERWDGSSWVNSYRSTYAYDSEGNRTEWLSENWENGQWVKSYSRSSNYGVLLPPPQQASADVADGTVALSWPSVEHDSLGGYRLYRARESFEDTSDATRVSEGLLVDASYSDDGLDNGGRYSYRLAAVSNSGLQSGLSEELLAVPHPSEVSAEASVSFGSGEETADYRLVALPGQPGTPLSETTSEEAGWRAFWDDGSANDYLIEHGGSASFDFEAGRGFWLVSTEDWSVSETFGAVSLEDSTTTIDLHDGWNIISNPLDKDVFWSKVEEVNGGSLQPIWSFEGSFVTTDAFASAKDGEAFYFLNDTGLDKLRVPYPRPTSSSSSKAQPVADAEKAAGLRLTAYRGEKRLSGIEVGITAGAEAPAKVVAPPNKFAEVSLWVEPEEASQKRQKRLASLSKKKSGDGVSFDLTLSSKEGKPVRLEASGLSSLEDKSVSLVEVEGGRSYDLRRTQQVTLRPEKEEASFRLLVGSEAYVGSEKEKLRPDELALHQNYPNPFSDQTTLAYTLPEAQDVRLSVYDALGREVAVLANGRRQAGRHRVSWNGEGRSGALSSGVYFTRLQAGGKTLTQKIVVVR